MQTSGDFFIPIIGEKVDGHKFILDCISQKNICGYFISSSYINKDEVIKKSMEMDHDIIIIEVSDTLQALICAGKFNRQKHIDVPIVAVTGSVGKTSTREIIASVLSTEKNVLVTEKNYNSNIGISIMCLKIDSQDVCVLEAGIDKFNEMEELSCLLKPDIACFTIIGTSHIGSLKTRENIFNEKFKLTKYLKGIKKVIVNGDDDLLCKVKGEHYDVIKIFDRDISCLKTMNEKITYNCDIYGKPCNVTLNQIGIHNAKNSLFAIKVGEIFNISMENIIKGIFNYSNFKNRLNYERLSDIQIVDDTYNSSFESIKSGISTILNISSNRKILVLGDVLDLGDKSIEIHKNIGNYLKDLDVDIILLSGKEMKYTYDVIKDSIQSKYFEDKNDIILFLLEYTKPDDIIYFKASNSMNYTDIVNKFKERLKQ